MKLLKTSVIASLLLVSSPLLASVILDVDANGQLRGAKNVEVNGGFYDVRFVDGSLIDVFGDASHLDAASRYESNRFSKALSETVIAGTVFDDDPEDVFGCSNVFLCDIITPYEIYGDDGPQQFSAYFSRNHVSYNGYYSYFGGSDPLVTQDFSLSDSHVFADWSVAAVPAPPATLLFTTGLLVLAGMRWLGLRDRTRCQIQLTYMLAGISSALPSAVAKSHRPHG